MHNFSFILFLKYRYAVFEDEICILSLLKKPKGAGATLIPTTIKINARNAVNDVGGGTCKIVPNNEIGFRSGK